MMGRAAAEVVYALMLVLAGVGMSLLCTKAMVPDMPPASPVQVCAPRQSTDNACAAWLFRSDLATAKKRMCGRSQTKETPK
jgi:hypothetical protein